MIRDIGFLEILKTNPGTSIQDQGRIGLGHWGVPIAGVMDQRSYAWINHLLKNKPNTAILEILQPGFKCRFDSYITIGLSGAKAEIRKNGELTSSTLLKIIPGDELEIGKFLLGSIVYLGIAQGFQTEAILSSRSNYPKITNTGMCSKGDKIPFFTTQSHAEETFASVRLKNEWLEEFILEADPGPDFEALSTDNKTQLFNSKFTISALANRMAFQLEELLPNSIPERLTAPVFPGTVQLTSGGKLLILMRDAQVTGGYPRILQLTDHSQSILAQKKPGQEIKFQLKITKIE
jgi:allophanate hydrolase subunit 2